MQSQIWISRRRVFAVVAFALAASLQACGGGGSAPQANESAQAIDASSAAAQASQVADKSAAPMPGDEASAAEGASELPASELAQMKKLSRATVGGLPCGLTPGNDWLAKNDKGDNSDPLNMVICLGGVTWDEVFASLAGLPGRTFNRSWPFPDVKGPWREVYAPPDIPLFRDSHCINAVTAQYGSSVMRAQDFSARENGCGSLWWTGVNHLRLWKSGDSAVLAVSTERPCRFGTTHCVVSFDHGRDVLANQLATVAENLHLTMVTSLYDTGHTGSIQVPDGSQVSYDGKVQVIALVR
jgi:hypothetical protein